MSQITYSFVKCLCSTFFLSSVNLICTDIFPKYFRESLGLRDTESTLYDPGHSISYNIRCAPSEDRDPCLSESSLSAWRSFRSLVTHRLPCEESYQSAWLRRLVWIFFEGTCNLIGNAVLRLLCKSNKQSEVDQYIRTAFQISNE